MRKKVNISDVAKAAGVSTTTVSRVMSGTGRISQPTRDRVFAVIEKLDYQPSAIAKGLIEAKTYNVGIVLSPNPESYNIYENNFLQLFLQGAITSLKKFQYDVVVSHGDESDTKTLDRFVKRQKVEGILVLNSLVDSPHIMKLKQIKFPFVVIGETDLKETKYVDANIKKTIGELVEKLSMQSENRIALLASDDNLYGNIVKSKALENEIKKQNLDFNENNIHIGNSFFERQMFLQNFMTDNKGNKSIITADYNSLLYVLNYVGENNIKVPDDLQIVTFDDNQLLSMFALSISAVKTPAVQMGEKAATMLMNIITKNEKDEYEHDYIVDTQITYRDSTFQ